VSLVVYDILGYEVTTLVNESKVPGTYEVVFSGSDLRSGVYFYQLKIGDATGNSERVFSNKKNDTHQIIIY